MPNSRRRKFSVRNNINGKRTSKTQNESQSSSNQETKTGYVTSLIKYSTSKEKTDLSKSNKRDKREIKDPASESVDSSFSSFSVDKLKEASSTADKNVTVNSSSIDLFNMVSHVETVVATTDANGTIEKTEMQWKRLARQLTDDKTSPKRDKYPHQHRVKIRSPKRRMDGPLNTSTKNNEVSELTINTATEAIDWDREIESSVNLVNEAELNRSNEEDERHSDNSSDDMCRICHGGDCLCMELGPLISACSCRGTVGRVHVRCLERWLTESGKSRCELCGTRYATRRVHRYGMPRAIIMWILSQNAKQLMVDSLGIMLMSPLAVLAAWLSGRSLAGLMTQEPHATPWPLASTFVLACMTLVCYYCWIVSAATRHALGWWIWYRSQYEVRLELIETEEL